MTGVPDCRAPHRRQVQHSAGSQENQPALVAGSRIEGSPPTGDLSAERLGPGPLSLVVGGARSSGQLLPCFHEAVEVASIKEQFP